jgi:hypothetical protein
MVLADESGATDESTEAHESTKPPEELPKKSEAGHPANHVKLRRSGGVGGQSR